MLCKNRLHVKYSLGGRGQRSRLYGTGLHCIIFNFFFLTKLVPWFSNFCTSCTAYWFLGIQWVYKKIGPFAPNKNYYSVTCLFGQLWKIIDSCKQLRTVASSWKVVWEQLWAAVSGWKQLPVVAFDI